jgi:hypothetical protein
MDKAVPVSLIRILESWYIGGTACVRWGSTFSHAFSLHAGVRQGGILSPVLFSLYINVIITELKLNGLGLVVYEQYMGCILYADDILLLACSLSVMQKMLNVTCKVLSDIDICINVDKSRVIRFGNRYNKSCVPLMMSGYNIKFCDKVNYLGVMLKAGMNVKFDTGKNCVAFYRAFNMLLHKCSLARSELICTFMLNSVCVPILTYAIEVLLLSSSEIKKLDTLINNAVRRIFNISDVSNISYVRSAVGLKHIEGIRRKRIANFILKSVNKPYCFRDVTIRAAIRHDAWLNTLIRHRSIASNVDEFIPDIRLAMQQIDIDMDNM